MAFKLFNWLLGSKENTETEETTGTRVEVKDFLDNDEGSLDAAMSYYIQRMAFWSAVRKIGSAVAAVEWQTYRRGKKVQAREYWSLNYEPNPNQTREQFFQKLVGKLYTTQEALVVDYRGNRYVADSFKTTSRLTGDIYSDITIGNDTLPMVYTAKDVLHFTISGDSAKILLTAISGMEGKLLKSAIGNYVRSQGTRGVLKIDDTAEAEADFDEIYADLIQEKFKKYFTAENAVLPLYNGYDFQPSESTGGSTKSSLSGTRDIKNMLDDIVEFTAQALGAPVSIVTGKNITDNDFKEFMTSIVRPLVRSIANEINRKVYGRDLVYAGTKVEPNYADVRHTDLFDVANPIDKLIGSGAFCINDIRQRLGLDVIDEQWAWQHWMTKNFSSVDDLLVGVDDTEPAAEPGREDDNGEE